MARRRPIVPDRWSPALPNPRPAAWDDPARRTGSPYACAPWEAGHEGEIVPGRGGGTVASCATPARRTGPLSHEGQFWLTRPGKPSRAMRKSVARRRKQRAGAVIIAAAPPELLEQSIERARARPDLPFPPGVPWPHVKGSARCSPEHAVWKGLPAAQRRAEKVVAGALDRDPFLSDAELDDLRAQSLRQNRRYPTWRDVTVDCVRGYDYTQANRRRATESTAREAQRHRAELLAAGVDPGSAEYLDTLSPSGRAKALRRLGRVAEARDLERVIRAKRRRR
jgi:hypothetical protein